jgi:hypothetical protein
MCLIATDICSVGRIFAGSAFKMFDEMPIASILFIEWAPAMEGSLGACKVFDTFTLPTYTCVFVHNALKH